jgi:uncharacterized protein (TIGR03437 family)
VYLTGQGLVDSPVATGAPAPASPHSKPHAAAEATLGGLPAEIQALVLFPGYVGLSQMNLLIPNVGSGEQPLNLSIGGVAANPTNLSIRVD